LAKRLDFLMFMVCRSKQVKGSAFRDTIIALSMRMAHGNGNTAKTRLPLEVALSGDHADDWLDHLGDHGDCV
jgi:hypothetical protein